MVFMATTGAPHITVDVESYRVAAGMPVLELSDKSGIARTSLRRKLAQPGLFTVDELNRLSTILGFPESAFMVAA